VPDERLPRTQHNRDEGSVQIRGVDAGTQAPQTALRRKAAYALGTRRVTFVDGDQLR
jgi:hypothetical protein